MLSCKKQSTNFIILSLQRHMPLFPSLKKMRTKYNSSTTKWDSVSNKNRKEATDECQGGMREGKSQEILKTETYQESKGFNSCMVWTLSTKSFNLGGISFKKIKCFISIILYTID